MKILSAIILILFLHISLQAQESGLVIYNFRVDGICGMCEDRIEKTALKHGAETAEWDVETKILEIAIDESKTSVSKIRYELAQAGHDNGNYIAPDSAYEGLHSCCKYRDSDAGVHSDEEEPNELHDENDELEKEKIDRLITDGYVYGLNEDDERFPLIGANVVLLGEDKEGTTTNFDGYFAIENPHQHKNLVISYIGFQTDTIELTSNDVLEIVLSDGHKLDEVVIGYKKRTTEVSFVKTLNIESINREELTKAACCNLSESFETNPSVDVSFTDAVTGTRQIQMLGLAGPYVQINREMIPDIRAMSSIYGFTYTPGPWIEGIQLVKGTGSVVSGFESIAGQINVELKKPEEGEKLHLNGYVNEGQRIELNANTRYEFGEKLSTGLLLHGKKIDKAHDRNGDGFLDMPLENDFIAVNRWKWRADNGWEGQFGAKLTLLDHEGGSHGHFEGSPEHQNHWLMRNKTNRVDAWLKTGIVFPGKPNSSVGFQLSGTYHDQEGEFGLTNYDNTQKSLYANLIYQVILPDPVHTLRAGVSYQYDDIFEIVSKSGAGVFERNESVPGAFFEYTYNDKERWSIVPGLRVDHHNSYGLFLTPRLHAKYNFAENSLIRITAGRGLRTANIFAENPGLFSTGRLISIENDDSENPYGLDAEVAWNYGINWTQAINVGEKEMILAVDLYRTTFENQIIVDYETPGELSFYNLDGSSRSNSFQIKLDYELFTGFDARLAYRLFDVKVEYRDGLKSKPLLPRHRAFLNLAYETENNWAFDMTWNWRGSQRIPSTASNPEEYRRPVSSPDYVLLNAQISKSWADDRFELYLGGENILNYTQDNAIIAAGDPFGPYFDASLVYAPLFGKNLYLGFRYNLI